MPTQWVEPDDMESMAGTKLPPSDWMVVEQERINTFADCTEDHQFIHIDEEAAAQGEFRWLSGPQLRREDGSFTNW